MLLYFTGVATSLSYKMKANTGTNNNDWTGIFTVEESVDGNSWTVLRTINSNTTNITTSTAGTVLQIHLCQPQDISGGHTLSKLMVI